MTPPRIVLTMIVKNERAVLERCVRSVRPLIDAWCIVDTGSTDGTQSFARDLLGDLPGDVHDIPWRDFAFNRTRALELARPLGDYSLMIDADVTCVVEPGLDLQAWRRSLTDDVYDIALVDPPLRYTRPLITTTRAPLRYRGVLHEFLDVPADLRRSAARGIHFRSFFDGARSQNPLKYLDDAHVLERALRSEEQTDLVPRYTFYLAQSHRDAGDISRALEVYERRAAMTDGWAEEAFVAWRWVAALRRKLDHDTHAVLDACQRAFDIVPTRAESLWLAAETAREAGRMPTAYLYASVGVAIPRPPTGLFLEPAVYDWSLQYELSVAAFYVGRFDEGRRASEYVIAHEAVPDGIRSTVRDNLRFYDAAQAPAVVGGNASTPQFAT